MKLDRPLKSAQDFFFRHSNRPMSFRKLAGQIQNQEKDYILDSQFTAKFIISRLDLPIRESNVITKNKIYFLSDIGNFIQKYYLISSIIIIKKS